jgi:hypothetical protein
MSSSAVARSPADSPDAKAWLNHAARTRRKINAAWWIQAFSPLAVGIGVAAFAVVFYLRSQGQAIVPWQAVAAIAGAAAMAALAAFLWAARRFYSTPECLARIEYSMRLNNALTAAAHGVAPWPPAQPATAIKDGFLWRWQWILVPAILAVACLALAFLIPVRAPDSVDPTPIPPPLATQQAEKLIQELKNEKLTRKEDLDKFQKAIDDLKSKPGQEWYSHSSLEAADTVRESLKQSVADLGQNMKKAAEGLKKMDALGDAATEAQRQEAAEQFSKALKGLETGGLQPNKELMEKLQKIDPKDLARQMNPEQLQALQNQLQNNAQKCKDCAGQGQSGGSEMGSDEENLRKMLSDSGNGPGGEGEQEEQENQADLGGGSPERGPGEAPLALTKKQSETNSSKVERPETRDYSRAAPGDLLGTADGEHTVDKTDRGPQEAGAISNTGEGGDALWRENLLPSEKRLLKRYFK